MERICPKCGSNNCYVVGDLMQEGYYVYCLDCENESARAETIAEASAHWLEEVEEIDAEQLLNDLEKVKAENQKLKEERYQLIKDLRGDCLSCRKYVEGECNANGKCKAEWVWRGVVDAKIC